jgi:uncharacterized membrane protein
MPIKLFLLAFPIFLSIDLLWLGFVAKNVYREQIGFLMRPTIVWWPAILFYICYVAGLVFFVLTPASKTSTLTEVFFRGAFFGFVAYAAYDLTNLATLKNWPLSITLVDLAWGAFLTGLVCVLTLTVSSKL